MGKEKKGKKGLTKHHLSYSPEIIVEIPSKGSHLILTSFQSMKPTKENIRFLKNFKRAVDYIIKQKTKELEQLGKERG